MARARFYACTCSTTSSPRVGGDARQRGGERADDFGVELGAGAAPELAQRVAGRPRAAVGARAGDGVVRVGDVHDARGERDVVAAQPVRIAAAVRPLVVQLDDRDVGREKRHRPQDARAGTGMLLDDVELRVGQRAGLEQHVVGHADLADVVQQRAQADDFDLLGRQAAARGRWPPTAR